jgi:hypothetical protein
MRSGGSAPIPEIRDVLHLRALSLGRWLSGRADALPSVGDHATIQTRPAIEHHAAVNAAAALDGHGNRLLSTIGALTPPNQSSVGAAAAALSHA